MNDKLDQSERLLRSPKVTTDERGRTVWIDPVETAEFELVSTQMLRQLIASGDAEVNNGLRKVAEGDDGLLARNTDRDRFEVINDAELQQILDGSDTITNDGSTQSTHSSAHDQANEDSVEIDLVSTQQLRIILDLEDEDAETGGRRTKKGFDPYDSG